MSCRYPIQIKSPLHDNATIFVPCNKCAWCRRQKQNEWCIRFEKEMKFNPIVRFVTFTYDEDNVPIKTDEETGETVTTVNKKDLQDYFKRARKDGKKFKYFGVSEYGSKNHRPHYHVLFFSKTPQKYEKYWFKGFTADVPATKGAFRYVTKYFLKGSSIPEGADENFMLCSKRPAIGFYLNEQEITNSIKTEQNGQTTFTTLLENGKRAPMPRYFRKKIRELFDESITTDWTNKTLEIMETLPRHSYLKQLYMSQHDNSEDGFEDFLNQKYKHDLIKQKEINKNEKF